MVDAGLRSRFDRQVTARLVGLRRRIRLYLLVDGLAVWLAAVLAAALVTLLVDRTFRLDRDMRAAQLVSLLAGLGGLAWQYLWRPLRVPMRMSELALLVERWHPRLQSRLVSAVELLAPASADPRRSPALVAGVVGQALAATGELSFHAWLNHGRARRRLAAVLLCLGLGAMASTLAPDLVGRWFARNVLLAAVDWPQANRLRIVGLQDGRLRVPRGEDLTVVAEVEPGYAAPRQVFLRFEPAVGGTGRVQMPAVRRESAATQPASAGGLIAPAVVGGVQFTHTFDRLGESLRCQVYGGDARTEPFAIEVVDRPRVTQATLRITPPAYSGIEPYSLRAGQSVAEVLAGSRVTFQVEVNRALARITLMRRLADEPEALGEAVPAGPMSYYADDVIHATSSYFFVLEDMEGLSNQGEQARPVHFSVRVLEDKPPRARLEAAGVGEMITPQAVLPLEIDLADAYGIAEAWLSVQRAGQTGEPARLAIPAFEPGTKRFAGRMDLLPAGQNAREQDRLNLRVEARDFDDVGGPNLGASAPITLRLVSREELLAELNRREQEYRQDFERLLRKQEELFSTWLRMVDAGPGESAEAGRRSLRQLARRQRDHAGRLVGLQAQFAQILSELRINQLATPEIEQRLAGRIIEPMERLQRLSVPAAAEALDRQADRWDQDSAQAARSTQSTVLGEMRAILAGMVQWEGFQEAVTLLRSIQQMQRELNQDTQKRIEEAILGPTTSDGP